MEHIELAGIHSGDSACILPSKHIPIRHLEKIKEYTKKIAKRIGYPLMVRPSYVLGGRGMEAVSYTHLDVYKRQALWIVFLCFHINLEKLNQHIRNLWRIRYV